MCSGKTTSMPKSSGITDKYVVREIHNTEYAIMAHLLDCFAQYVWLGQGCREEKIFSLDEDPR